MFSFYIVSTINAHLIELNIFNTNVAYLVLKHRDSKQRNLHKHFIRLYLVFSIGFASICMVTIVRRMFNMPFDCLLEINLLYNIINSKVSVLETKMADLDTRLTQNETSCEFLSSINDENTKELKSTKEDLSKLQKSCKLMLKHLDRNMRK